MALKCRDELWNCNNPNDFADGLVGLYNLFANETASDLCEKILLSRDKNAQREVLESYFKKWDGCNISAVKLDIPGKLLKEIITDEVMDEENVIYRKFVYSIDELKMLDLNDFDFSNVLIDGIDFSLLTGVKIDPQMVYRRSLQDCNFSGVIFTGEFNNTRINSSDFRGSINATIDLRYIGDISGINNRKTILTDANIIKDSSCNYKLHDETVVTQGANIADAYTNRVNNDSSYKNDLLDILNEYLDPDKLTRRK